MTTHLPSQTDNAVPHTPPIMDDGYPEQHQQHNGQRTSSPLASPSGMKRDLSYANSPKSLEGIEKKKRKYSAGIYKWTQVMWESARQDIERRASVSSTDSEATSESFGSGSYNDNSGSNEKFTVLANTEDDAARDISSVPALH
ncbi:hypothetical protein IAU59_001514 [Kwoniella sp. CBS 9459]